MVELALEKTSEIVVLGIEEKEGIGVGFVLAEGGGEVAGIDLIEGPIVVRIKVMMVVGLLPNKGQDLFEGRNVIADLSRAGRWGVGGDRVMPEVKGGEKLLGFEGFGEVAPGVRKIDFNFSELLGFGVFNSLGK